MPKISVIMSVYNADNYDILISSVQSILNQDFKDFEFIICNDGSSNNKTNEYLKMIKELDPRIKIIGYKKNMGLAYSRNQCIKICNGKYIAFQDDDDKSEKNRLRIEYDFLEKNQNYSFVGTTANVFEKDKIWGKFDLPEKPVRKDFLWNSPFLNPSMMFRKSVLQEIGGFRVSKETKRAEDYDLFMRLYSKGYKGYNIQQRLFNYRINIDNEKKKKYRPMKDRISEAKVRYRGFKLLHLGYKSIPYVIKPIIVGLIPTSIFYKIRKRQYEQ